MRRPSPARDGEPEGGSQKGIRGNRRTLASTTGRGSTAALRRRSPGRRHLKGRGSTGSGRTPRCSAPLAGSRASPGDCGFGGCRVGADLRPRSSHYGVTSGGGSPGTRNGDQRRTRPLGRSQQPADQGQSTRPSVGAQICPAVGREGGGGCGIQGAGERTCVPWWVHDRR